MFPIGWSFNTKCVQELAPHLMQNVEDNHMDLFTSALQYIAGLTIPKTSTVHKKNYINPGGMNSVRKHRDRKKALNIFKKFPTKENLEQFKLKYAKVRIIIMSSMKRHGEIMCPN